MRGMNKGIKIAVALLAAGVLLCGAALASVGFDWSKLGTGEYVVRTYPVSGAFNNVSIVGDMEKIAFVPSSDGTCSVVCMEREKEPHTVRVEGDTLTVGNNTGRNWHLLDFSFLVEGPAITVYLPESTYRSLIVDARTGSVDVPADFTFDSVCVTLSTGSVNCRVASAGDVTLTTTTGHIQVSGLSAQTLQLSASTGGIRADKVICAGGMEVHVTTGGVSLNGVRCGSLISTGSTGGLSMTDVVSAGEMSLRRSTGGVRFEGCDAESIFIKTSTGSVRGSLLTGKSFVAHSGTGRVEVPESAAGGKCEITTSTGGIHVEVKNK